MAAAQAEPHLLVVFGATGDLARRKLYPALARVVLQHDLAETTALMGVSLDDLDDAGFRSLVETALGRQGLAGDAVRAWCERMFHTTIEPDGDLDLLAGRVSDVEADLGLRGNRVLYLALPPVAFVPTIRRLAAAGLHQSEGWTRLVVEKPFGHDGASARALNEVIHEHFAEEQVFRIDHYLGKETVQNLLTFRFANVLFESTWNRDRIASVEITVAEKLGIEGRGGYYDRAGVVRDMVQNHLTQLVTLVAMEAPSSLTAGPIRNEKVQVLESIRPVDVAAVVLGRYTAGTIDEDRVPGYREEDGVPDDSSTPTFAGVRLSVENYRWHGVPFYLRTGKRLPARTTQIAVTYQTPPVCLFHGTEDDCPTHPNVVILTLQPDEGFEVRFELKAPGEPLRLVSKPLSLDYRDAFASEPIPDAYETLLLDVMQGDQTLFVRADEVEASWHLWDPVIAAELPVHPYAAGTWGPAATDAELAIGDGSWAMRSKS